MKFLKFVAIFLCLTLCNCSLTGKGWKFASETHDTLNSVIWYDELSNGKDLDGTILGNIGNTTNMTNVPLAIPFALSVLLPPEVLNTIFALIKSK